MSKKWLMISGVSYAGVSEYHVNFQNEFSLENQYREKGVQSIQICAFTGKNTCGIQRKMVKVIVKCIDLRYVTDKEERYFHLYYSEKKACAEREQIESGLERMTRCLEQWKGQARAIANGFKTHFDLEIYEPDGTFLLSV